MITRFSVKNYKALRDVSLDLTPMHVLIGPNDSGKTSILEAVAALCRSVDRPIAEAFGGKWEGLELVWRNELPGKIELSAIGSYELEHFDYILRVQFDSKNRNVWIRNELFMHEGNYKGIANPDGEVEPRVWSWVWKSETEEVHTLKAERKLIYGSLKGVQVCRWIPRFLGLPNALDVNRQFKLEPTGFGLTHLLDDILGEDRELFVKLEARFKAIFPQVETIRFRQESAYLAAQDDAAEVPELQRRDGKGLFFQLKDQGALVPASQVSDGMLIILAYLAILHLPQPPRVLLIEEPENGIHPARLAEVLSILRELIAEQDHTQVILTTHSPYVVDHFEPKEVTLCYKGDDGAVRTRRLSESKAVVEQVDVFTLGEIWTADGDEKLLEPAEPAEQAE